MVTKERNGSTEHHAIIGSRSAELQPGCLEVVCWFVVLFCVGLNFLVPFQSSLLKAGFSFGPHSWAFCKGLSMSLYQ